MYCELKKSIQENFYYQILLQKHRHDDVNELVELVTMTILDTSQTVRLSEKVSVTKFAFQTVVDQLRFEHIDQLLTTFREKNIKVINVKAYMLTSIYNSVFTISTKSTLEIEGD